MKNLLPVLFLFLAAGISAQNFTTYREADGLADDNVSAVVTDDDGTVYFATNNGVSIFDGTTWTTYNQSTHPEMLDNVITAIEVDSKGNIWAGTDFGAMWFNDTVWTTITEDDGLANNRVTFLFEDFEGIMWACNKGGVTLIEGPNMISLTQDDGLPFGGIDYVTYDGLGNKFMGSALGGMIKFDGININYITEDDGLVSNKVRGIAADKDNNKWVATSSGISVTNINDEVVDHHTRIFSIPPPDTLNPVTDVKIDSKGNVWAGVFVDYLVSEGGVSFYDGTDWIDYDVADGLAGHAVTRLAVDPIDDVWVATSTGVTKISFGSSSTDDIPELTGFEIFPNPAADFIQVNLELTDYTNSLSANIYNTLGQLVRKEIFAKGQISKTIDTADFAAGLYFLQIGQQVQQVVIE